MPERLLYRVSEAANVLGISRSALYELIDSGEIRAIRVKSDLRIPVADLNTWIAKKPSAFPRRRQAKR